MSLFSGAGGLDLGFRMQGDFETLFANELLEAPAETFSRNFQFRYAESSEEFSFYGKVMVRGDVEKIDFSGVEPETFDVVLGGPPCQDFSVLRGKNSRMGITVKRGRLYSHFVRALVHAQPKVFVFENVPGLISANSGTAYKTITEDFQNLSLRWDDVKKLVGNGCDAGRLRGYSLIFSGIVDFVRLGVPQNRRRLIVIGVRKDLMKNLPKSKFEIIKRKIQADLNGENMAFKDFPLTPIEVLEGATLDSLQCKYKAVMEAYSDVADGASTPKARGWKTEVWDKLTFDVVKDYILLNKIQDSLEKKALERLKEALEEHRYALKLLGYLGSPVEGKDYSDLSNKLPKENGAVAERLKKIPPGENYEFVEGTEWEVTGLMSNVYRKINPVQPSPTIIAYGGGGTWNYHYRRDRGRLTNRERARLQTFPDWFLFSGSEQQVRAQIGEAVPPLASYYIAKSVSSVLQILKTI